MLEVMASSSHWNVTMMAVEVVVVVACQRRRTTTMTIKLIQKLTATARGAKKMEIQSHSYHPTHDFIIG